VRIEASDKPGPPIATVTPPNEANSDEQNAAAQKAAEDCTKAN